MLNKTAPTIILFSVAFLLMWAIFFNNGKQSGIENPPKTKKIIIAACPTCYEIAKKLDSKKYQVILTASTAESIELIKNKRADLILAGRTLKPSEPQMEEIIIADGFSFIANEEFYIYEDELKYRLIYTDIDVESIKNNFPIEKIEKVDNVYQYLDRGIAITSWENTDYNQANIVHILKNTGERTTLSRRIAIYCPQSCGRKEQEIVSLIK